MAVLRSGVQGLDRLFSAGGFYAGDSVLVEGGAGVGKTTLGLQFIVAGIRDHGEPGMIFSFEELPQEFHRNSRHYGWHLKDMEAAGKLDLFHTSPEDLVKEMEKPGSALLRKIEEMGVRRALVDSVNPMHRLHPRRDEMRQILLRLIKAFRREGITLMLTLEGGGERQSDESLEHYLCDTVVLLSHEIKGGMRRRRLLEVLKSRGQDHVEGRQLFLITNEGLSLLAPLVQIKPLVPRKHVASTGIAALDDMLGGGMPHGSTFLFTTDGTASLYPFFIALAAAGLAAREGVKFTPSARNSFHDIQRFLMDHSYDISGLAQGGQVRFVDYYHRPAPGELKPYILDVSRMSLAQYRLAAARLGRHYKASKLRWRRLLDVNAGIDRFGAEEFKAQHTARIADIKARGDLGLLFSVPAEMDPRTEAFLRYTCSGVVETWVEDGYQFLRVSKTPSGRVSDPGVVEVTGERPFVKIR